MLKYAFSKKRVSLLPETPGVYIFEDKGGPIYIGKAKNLKSRVSSYLGAGIFGKTKAMVQEIETLSFIQTLSEFEAILLEAQMVRKLMPKYNFQLKDDKSPLYIGITKEKFPRVLTLRKTQIKGQNLKAVFGPFTNGLVVKRVLKTLRRAFPFSTHKKGKRGCLESQIGLCNPCPSLIQTSAETQLYQTNIKNLTKVLAGNIKGLKQELTRKMAKYSQENAFEKARKIRDQIAMLEYVTSPQPVVGPYLENPNFYQDLRAEELQKLRILLAESGLKIKNLSRIECFDVAHLAGSFPTASMVTFVDGEPEKRLYRHFKIRKEKFNNDVEALRIIFNRRSKHFATWGKPDLIVVDGGKGQVSAAEEIIKEIPIIGLAKGTGNLILKDKGKFKAIALKKGPARNLIERLDSEAHRFARRLHHKQVSAILKNK
jgi:excinuclease ABC subunit C